MSILDQDLAVLNNLSSHQLGSTSTSNGDIPTAATTATLFTIGNNTPIDPSSPPGRAPSSTFARISHPSKRKSSPPNNRKPSKVNNMAPNSSDEDLLEISGLVEDGILIDRFKADLAALDPSLSLSIHGMADHYKTDPLVQEYVDIILDLQIIPKLPRNPEQENFNPTIPLPKDTFIPILTNLITYYQSLYFDKNLKAAEENQLGVFNFHTNFKIPSFNLLPMASLASMAALKVQFVKDTQKFARQGSQFTRELLMLRNFKIIQNKLGDDIPLTTLQSHIRHYISVAVMRAHIEFLNSYNYKVTDWSKKKSKVILTEPGWRKQNPSIPPTQPANFYAKNVPSIVRKEDLSAQAVSVIYQQHNQQLRIENGRLVGLKTHHPPPIPTQHNGPKSGSWRNNNLFTNKFNNNRNNFNNNRHNLDFNSSRPSRYPTPRQARRPNEHRPGSMFRGQGSYKPNHSSTPVASNPTPSNPPTINTMMED